MENARSMALTLSQLCQNQGQLPVALHQRESSILDSPGQGGGPAFFWNSIKPCSACREGWGRLAPTEDRRIAIIPSN